MYQGVQSSAAILIHLEGKSRILSLTLITSPFGPIVVFVYPTVLEASTCFSYRAYEPGTFPAESAWNIFPPPGAFNVLVSEAFAGSLASNLARLAACWGLRSAGLAGSAFVAAATPT